MSSVEFVSYDGDYPNLCSGILKLRIDGKVVEFPRYCMVSGGGAYFDDNWDSYIVYGPWTVKVPEEFAPLRSELSESSTRTSRRAAAGDASNVAHAIRYLPFSQSPRLSDKVGGAIFFLSV